MFILYNPMFMMNKLLNTHPKTLIELFAQTFPHFMKIEKALLVPKLLLHMSSLVSNTISLNLPYQHFLSLTFRHLSYINPKVATFIGRIIGAGHRCFLFENYACHLPIFDEAQNIFRIFNDKTGFERLTHL